MTKQKSKSMIQRRLIPTYIFLGIVSFISVFPLYWMISAATNTSTDVSRGRLLPGTHFMENFKNLMSKAKLLNTAVGFMLPIISTPFMIMMFRQNARAFPVDIIEAARIDGLSEVQIFFRMFIPTMKSTYAAAAVITFMNAWNAYLWPKVIMSDNRAMTMPMLIANLITGYKTDYGMLMCGVLFCSIPTMIVFFVLQKQFAEGITGAVK